MESSLRAWSASLKTYAQKNRWATGLFILSALGTLALFLESLVTVVWAESLQALTWATLGGVACFLANAVGALPALLLKRISQTLEDILLGFSGGMMLAASVFSLLIPGIDAAESLFVSKTLSLGVVILGVLLGAFLMIGLDQFSPHEHPVTGACGPAHERMSRIVLFVIAIALHNVPEGMAVGVAFAGNDLSVGMPLTLAIALQDIPEGLAVALALRGVGVTPLRAVSVSILTGFLEVLGAWLGVGLAGGLAVAYPLGLGFAAGAMLFVVSHEVIPETHRNGHELRATIGLLFGFILMMVLDTALG